MNEEAHWNNIAKNYNQEIFDVFHSDKKKILSKFFKKHANKEAIALDFGCGNGKAFPFLSPLFKKIIAVDISAELIGQAKRLPFKNISFLQRDLADVKVKLPKADFIFSCNVIMLPEIDKNYSMLQNVHQALSNGGSAVIVIPSSESILFSGWQMMEWYKKENVPSSEIASSELSYFKGTKKEIVQGIFYIDNVATKHYSAPEIEVIFNNAHLKVTALKKVEYDWDTEFDSSPNWMGKPYPWDWLVECKRAEQ